MHGSSRPEAWGWVNDQAMGEEQRNGKRAVGRACVKEQQPKKKKVKCMSIHPWLRKKEGGERRGGSYFNAPVGKFRA